MRHYVCEISVIAEFQTINQCFGITLETTYRARFVKQQLIFAAGVAVNVHCPYVYSALFAYVQIQRHFLHTLVAYAVFGFVDFSAANHAFNHGRGQCVKQFVDKFHFQISKGDGSA